MDGILNINKPSGPTSFDIVSLVRRLSGERRVGHAGTLDPAASGVLPVCIGKATRVIEFLMDGTKMYRAEIELGTATDSYDAEGSITDKGDPIGISREQVESELASFIGTIQQIPPAFSALKHQGKPLYEWARAGVTVDVKSRPVTIQGLELTDWQFPSLTIEVTCGKGTYIRSIAHDLGRALGCGAHLKNLIRLKCGIFDIETAVPVSKLEEAFREGNGEQYLFPLDKALGHLTAVTVDEDTQRNIINGRLINLEAEEQTKAVGAEPENSLRVYTAEGRFLALLRFDAETGGWHPWKVFP